MLGEEIIPDMQIMESEFWDHLRNSAYYTLTHLALVQALC